MSIGGKNDIKEVPGPGEGRLILNITDKNYIRIGKVRIYLDSIVVSGEGGGNRQVKLQFFGPKDGDKIERVDR